MQDASVRDGLGGVDEGKKIVCLVRSYLLLLLLERGREKVLPDRRRWWWLRGKKRIDHLREVQMICVSCYPQRR